MGGRGSRYFKYLVECRGIVRGLIEGEFILRRL